MNPETIVIGAGAAGLAAAEKLGARGRKVLVVEARERAGGRIYTVNANDDSDFPIELGAEFVHGVVPEIFEIAREADLKIVETAGASWCVDERGDLSLCDEPPDSGEDRIWRRILEYDGTDLSLEEFFAKHCAEPDSSRATNAVRRFVAGFHAADTTRAGILGIARTTRAGDDVQGERAFRFSGGYKQIVNRLHEQCLARAVEFRFDSVVRAVRWQAGKVEVEVETTQNNERRTFVARNAIVTLPLGVLKAGADDESAVLFEPALDAKKDALANLEMGAAARVVLQFRRDWWTEKLAAINVNRRAESNKLGFLMTREQLFGVWWSAAPLEPPVLTAWLGGENARKFSELDRDAVVRTAIESLAGIFKIEQTFVESELQAAFYHDWQIDVFARGAYSYVGTNGINANHELARPLANTLFFAGEATDSAGHWATVHGAIASGRRAAAEILAT